MKPSDFRQHADMPPTRADIIVDVALAILIGILMTASLLCWWLS